MRRSFFAAGVATAVTLLFGANPSMADSAKYPVKGLVKSGSATGAGTAPVTVVDNTAAPSTATASGKVLLLSQACFKVDALNTVTLTAGTLTVSFAASNSNGGTGCQSFGPGLVISEGTDVTCAATGTANFSCTASGIVTKRQ